MSEKIKYYWDLLRKQVELECKTAILCPTIYTVNRWISVLWFSILVTARPVQEREREYERKRKKKNWVPLAWTLTKWVRKADHLFFFTECPNRYGWEEPRSIKSGNKRWIKKIFYFPVVEWAGILRLTSKSWVYYVVGWQSLKKPTYSEGSVFILWIIRKNKSKS